MLATATALVLASCGGGTHARAGGPPLVTNGPPVADRDHAQLPPGTLHLRRALLRQLRRRGLSASAVVYDLTAHRMLFRWGATVPRPPASIEKLYTTIALASRLGPQARLRTEVLGVGRLARNGVWVGNLYLRGGGDPTFGDAAFNRVWTGGFGPTAAQLVSQLREQGIRRLSGQLIADESAFDTRRGGPQSAYAPDIPDFGGQLSALTYDHGSANGFLTPAAFAARQLARTLSAARVKARAATLTGRAPRGARVLAVVYSPPLKVLLRLMDVPSDDLYAELLTKQLGRRFAHSGSTAAGARVISRAIARYGLHPRILDGSGLSRADSTSALGVVDLLRRTWQRPAGRTLLASLPVVGLEGTVRPIAPHSAARGNCAAKTGTLNNVTNLAGVCRAHGRHILAFALMLDGQPNDIALTLVGKMLAAVARY